MRAARIVPGVSSGRASNLATVLHMAEYAASQGGKLAVLPEAVLTGLINNVEGELPR